MNWIQLSTRPHATSSRTRWTNLWKVLMYFIGPKELLQRQWIHRCLMPNFTTKFLRLQRQKILYLEHNMIVKMRWLRISPLTGVCRKLSTSKFVFSHYLIHRYVLVFCLLDLPVFWFEPRLQTLTFQFLPRDALLCKARYCDRMSSVCPSVCLSVRLW